MLRQDAAFLRDFRKSKHERRQAFPVIKPLESAWVSTKVGWGRVSGNHDGGLNMGGKSDMAPAGRLHGGRDQQGNHGLS